MPKTVRASACHASTRGGERGAFAAAGDADRDPEPAAAGEPGHHRPLRPPLLSCGIDRRVVPEESIRRTVDLRRRQGAGHILRGGPGKPDQFAFLLGMECGCHTPALLAAQPHPPAPQQRHLSAVLHHPLLAEGLQHRIDVVAGLVADPRHDQGAGRGLAQFGV
jgi:hypothetical protein